MSQIIQNELDALLRHMEQNKCAPSEEIIADNEAHTYSVVSNGVVRVAHYIATLYPFGHDPNSPILVCHYGFEDERGGGFSYSSLMEK